jgi:hypothetical protein
MRLGRGSDLLALVDLPFHPGWRGGLMQQAAPAGGTHRENDTRPPAQPGAFPDPGPRPRRGRLFLS